MAGVEQSDEQSLRYPGWRIVFAIFVVELFIFGFGLYGHGVYLSELQRLHGWSTSIISTGSTLSLVLGSLFSVFVGDLLRWMGPRRLLFAGTAALASSIVLLAVAQTVVQLYVAFLLLAAGWTGLGTVGAAAIVGAWFDRRRGLAISLAFTGATSGGVFLTPALVFLTGAIGYQQAMLYGAAIAVAVLVPVIAGLIGPPPSAPEQRTTVEPGFSSAIPTRLALLRSASFWSVTAPFSLALLAQVAFIVHQIAILEPTIGRPLAGVAVSFTIGMALVGRIGLGFVVDHINPRRAAAASFLSQALALGAMIGIGGTPVLFAACAVFGFSIGNLITLPPLIVHREFAQAQFSTVLGLSTAVTGVVNAFGPALAGLLRDFSGGYTVPLVGCIVLEVVSAIAVLVHRSHRSA